MSSSLRRRAQAAQTLQISQFLRPVDDAFRRVATSSSTGMPAAQRVCNCSKMSVMAGPTTLYIQLPPTGTMTLPVPEGAPDVTYTLRAQSAEW